MKKQFSAGVVLYKYQDGTRYYLILKYPGGYWDLPKGKLEDSETKLEAAVRELKEETDLEVEILPGFERTIHYIFRGHDKDLIDKEVTFFVGKALTTEVVISFEHQEYKWTSLAETVTYLRYDNARQIISDADVFVESRGD